MKFFISFIFIFLTITFLLIKYNVIQINKKLIHNNSIGQESFINKIIPDQEPSFIMDATTIIDEYKANEDKADQKYKNNIIQINGVVKNKGKDSSNNKFIMIGTEKLIDARKIRCTSSFDNINLDSIKIGSNITVKGKANGFSLNVRIEDCTIIP